jgi:hypothetical protein
MTINKTDAKRIATLEVNRIAALGRLRKATVEVGNHDLDTTVLVDYALAVVKADAEVAATKVLAKTFDEHGALATLRQGSRMVLNPASDTWSGRGTQMALWKIVDIEANPDELINKVVPLQAKDVKRGDVYDAMRVRSVDHNKTRVAIWLEGKDTPKRIPLTAGVTVVRRIRQVEILDQYKEGLFW